MENSFTFSNHSLWAQLYVFRNHIFPSFFCPRLKYSFAGSSCKNIGLLQLLFLKQCLIYWTAQNAFQFYSEWYPWSFYPQKYSLYVFEHGDEIYILQTNCKSSIHGNPNLNKTDKTYLLKQVLTYSLQTWQMLQIVLIQKIYTFKMSSK